MSNLLLSLSVLGAGALFGIGIRWGFWISDNISEIVRDLLRRKP